MMQVFVAPDFCFLAENNSSAKPWSHIRGLRECSTSRFHFTGKRPETQFRRAGLFRIRLKA